MFTDVSSSSASCQRPNGATSPNGVALFNGATGVFEVHEGVPSGPLVATTRAFPRYGRCSVGSRISKPSSSSSDSGVKPARLMRPRAIATSRGECGPLTPRATARSTEKSLVDERAREHAP